MLRRATEVELITHEHRFTAKVYTHGQRLLDMLNDRTTDYLKITDAEVHRYSDPEKSIAVFPTAIIRKEDLHLAIIPGEDHEAPTQRLFGYVQKSPYHVFLTVPGYEVRGVMYLTIQREPDPIHVLESHARKFFAVTGATASQAWTGEDVLSCPVVMVNKDSLSLFYVGEDRVK
ncbi:MAG: hypothetical protein ACE5LU_01370 [Anaerolineae bacterium]